MHLLRRIFAALLLAPGLGCASSGAPASPDASVDASAGVIDLCDAFTGVGNECPFASPLRCFPGCEASGCFCRGTDAGPRWDCVTDLSCVPDCAPLENGCGGH